MLVAMSTNLNIKKNSVSPPPQQYIYVFHISLIIQSDFFPEAQ
jgi:hypothetical protein